MQKNKHLHFPQCTHVYVHMPAPFTLTARTTGIHSSASTLAFFTFRFPIVDTTIITTITVKLAIWTELYFSHKTA